MFKVTFRFENGNQKEINAPAGENLLSAAKRVGVEIDAPCAGNGVCGKCRVKLVSGELEMEPSLHINEEEFVAGWRIACKSKVVGDVEIEVPNSASAYKSNIRTADLSDERETYIFENVKTELKAAGINGKSKVSVLELNLPVPSLDDTMPDNERICRAISEQIGNEVILPFSVLNTLPDVLREENFAVKCVVGQEDNRSVVYDVFPASHQIPVCGLAIDIGTTTVSTVLVDINNGNILAKASAGNGQIRYGADVINRIIESSRSGGKERLRKAVTDDTINLLISSMCKTAGIKAEQIYRVCVAGNTTMNHLLLGLNADPVRMEPYIPAFFSVSGITAGDLGIVANKNAAVCIAPNVGSYVGGDITSGTLASLIWSSEQLSLFIDLGTNGELVFGNREFLMCCACSAGPAFEGGDISCGMRATDGAIEECVIDEETMEPSFTIIGETKPVGICGSGLIDMIAELFRCKIIDAKGMFRREGKRVARDEHGTGRYIAAFKEESKDGREVSLTEVDIDNFIRAKGAIFSAIRIMLDSLDFDVSMLERVMVAGGIGSGINIKNAISIGMLPNIPEEMYSYIGNASLEGAYSMLVSDEAEAKVSELGSAMTYLELSTNPKYMDEFVAACFIPHTDGTLFGR